MAPSDQLNSWKEIAAHLQRDVETVRRWEKTLGLPVRRLDGDAPDAVFALRAEIDAWRDAQDRPLRLPVGAAIQANAQRSTRSQRWILTGVALVLALAAGSLLVSRTSVLGSPKLPAFQYVTDGASDRPVTGAAISPDGLRLAYADVDHIIYVLALSKSTCWRFQTARFSECRSPAACEWNIWRGSHPPRTSW